MNHLSPGRTFPPASQMNRLVRLVLNLMPTELRQLTLAAGLDVEATCRLQPLAELFALARKSRGWSPPKAAKATGTRRRTIDAAESANPSRLDPAELIAYSSRLGTLHLLGEWVSANPRLAKSLGLPDEESLLSHGRQILVEDARPLAILPNLLPSLVPHRFEAPPGFSDHLDPDRAEERLSGLLASSMPDSPPHFPDWDAPSADTPEPVVALPSKPSKPAIYELRITLNNVHPPVWRRIRVPNGLTFARFHRVLQATMGWEDDHLHAFQWRDLDIGLPDPEWNHPVLDESRITLATLGLRARSKLSYHYDFGDDWKHDIRIEKVLPHDPNAIPLCLEGEGACPPEDCGGPFAYTEMLAARDLPHSPAAAEFLEAIAPEWKPGIFDPAQVNADLSRLARSWNRKRAAA